MSVTVSFGFEPSDALRRYIACELEQAELATDDQVSSYYFARIQDSSLRDIMYDSQDHEVARQHDQCQRCLAL